MSGQRVDPTPRSPGIVFNACDPSIFDAPPARPARQRPRSPLRRAWAATRTLLQRVLRIGATESDEGRRC